MKISIEFLKDNMRNFSVVKASLQELEKLLSALRKYRQTLKIRSDFKKAFEEVALLKRTETKKQTLKEFPDELYGDHKFKNGFQTIDLSVTFPV